MSRALEIVNPAPVCSKGPGEWPEEPEPFFHNWLHRVLTTRTLATVSFGSKGNTPPEIRKHVFISCQFLESIFEKVFTKGPRCPQVIKLNQGNNYFLGSKLKIWKRQRIISPWMSWWASRVEKEITLVLTVPTAQQLLHCFKHSTVISNWRNQASERAWIDLSNHSDNYWTVFIIGGWKISSLDKLLSLWIVPKWLRQTNKTNRNMW